MLNETESVLAKVKEIATLAGMKVGIDEDRGHVATGFCFTDGRSQAVYIRHSGVVREKNVVTFFSPCLELKSGFMSGISKERAIDLLTRNEQMMFGRFGLWRSHRGHMVVVSSDQLLETMDPEEFTNHAGYVAVIADRYEREHGRDDY